VSVENINSNTIVESTITIGEIRSLLKNERLIPFIGAGLSKNLGLPNWEGLIQILADDLDLSPREFDIKGDFLQFAEYYILVKGSVEEFKQMMHRYLHPSEEAIINSPIYNTLVDLRFPIIYTTNFDDIIERAYALKKVKYHAISDLPDLISYPKHTPQIVKIHGTYNDDSGIVLTESHFFDRLEFENAIDIKFKHDLLGNTMMFLGYSFRDINIRYRIYEMMKFKQQAHADSEGRPTAILIDFNIGRVRKKVLSARGIPFVELCSDNKGRRVAEFLQLLR
jgi:hypothetical protein